jgi:hypothetical protein
MKQASPLPAATVAKAAALTLGLAALTGIAFASWLDHGAGIFIATVESGLSWCF